MKKSSIYKIIFLHHGAIYEIYAKHVDPMVFYGFVEIGELIFRDTSSIVVDPAEEKLKAEFAGVNKTYVPIHYVLRIDEVDKEGTAKIKDHSKSSNGNVTRFPMGNGYSSTDE